MSKEPSQDHVGPADRWFACPNCEFQLEWKANFCVNCGIDVSAFTTSNSNATCPDCGTDIAAMDNFCINCGTMLSDYQWPTGKGESYEDATTALESQADDSAEVPESLVLAVEGHEISVRDGDTVGSEIRAALSEAGRPDAEVVRIHREHVRFIRKNGCFYLLDLADNSTHLNGCALSKGDRKPVEPGDALELSEVAAVTIQSP